MGNPFPARGELGTSSREEGERGNPFYEKRAEGAILSLEGPCHLIILIGWRVVNICSPKRSPACAIVHIGGCIRIHSLFLYRPQDKHLSSIIFMSVVLAQFPIGQSLSVLVDSLSDGAVTFPFGKTLRSKNAR